MIVNLQVIEAVDDDRSSVCGKVSKIFINIVSDLLGLLNKIIRRTMKNKELFDSIERLVNNK